MDKVSVNPGSVRCLGNIVSPKTSTDFGTLNGTVSSGSDTVNSQTMTVYSTDYLVGSSITLSYDKLIDEEDTSFTVTATLKDNTSTVVDGATVYCDVNDTVTSGTTNSSGVCTFTVATDGSSKYRFKVYYQGTVSLAGCVANGVVYSADPDNIDLLSDAPIIQDDETSHLIAILSDGDRRIPGQVINFYDVWEPTTLTVMPTIFQSGVTGAIKAVLKDEDGSGIKGETIKIYKITED